MLFWLGISILISYGLIALEVVRGSRRIDFLRDQEVAPGAQLPSVSIIVAARNEERHIRAALSSLLKLDYPALQLVVVDDRSEDCTGTIIADMAREDARLEILTLQELPAGWLGKNHALSRGSQRASGELLLFTDADVVMAPDSLQRAVVYLQQKQLDHLAVTPEAHMPSLSLNMFGAVFGLFFAIFTRPWRAAKPNSRCHIGIGAFNLVRRDAYRLVGGHRTIALRPDDDLKLGKILKRAGCRQRLAYGTGLIRVEWYASFRELVLGLEKNLFAGTDYRIWMVLGGAIFHLLASLWPYLALLFTHGATQLVYLAVVLVISLLMADTARFNGYNPWYALGFPFTAALFTYILLRTLSCNLVKGGIRWRGTFYPLSELRRNRV